MAQVIYNVTMNIDHAVASDWLQWMKNTHVPEVLATGMFSGARMLRLLGDEDSGGLTYAMQYTAENMQAYEQYRDVFAPALQVEIKQRYGDKIVAFRTLLEVVE